MKKPEVWLGRSGHGFVPDFNLSALSQSKAISHKHASVTFLPEQHAYCINLLGKNGIKVNGVLHKTTADVPTPQIPLQHGDLIETAHFQYFFMVPAEALTRGPVA